MKLQPVDSQVPVQSSGPSTQSSLHGTQLVPLGQPGGGDRDIVDPIATTRKGKGKEQQVVKVQCSYPWWRPEFYGTQKVPYLSDCNGERDVETQIRNHILVQHRNHNDKHIGTPYHTPPERFDYIEQHWRSWKKDLNREQLLNRINWVLFCEANVSLAGQTTLEPYPFNTSNGAIQQALKELHESNVASTNALNLSEPILAWARAEVQIARIKLEQAKHHTKQRLREYQQVEARLAEDKRYEDFCSKMWEEAVQSLGRIEDLHAHFKMKQALNDDKETVAPETLPEKTRKRPRTSSQSTVGSPAKPNSQLHEPNNLNLGFHGTGGGHNYPELPNSEDFQSLEYPGPSDHKQADTSNSSWSFASDSQELDDLFGI